MELVVLDAIFYTIECTSITKKHNSECIFWPHPWRILDNNIIDIENEVLTLWLHQAHINPGCGGIMMLHFLVYLSISFEILHQWMVVDLMVTLGYSVE